MMCKKLDDIVTNEENSNNVEDSKEYNFYSHGLTPKKDEINSNYDYTKSKKELELKHIELNLYQRKWIVCFILGYVALVFIFTVIFHN